MSIVCRECGFENEDGEKYCAMCNANLSAPQADKAVKTRPNRTKKFFVNCENSRSKTYVESNDISSYYCEGCKEVHQIDGFFWIVQQETTDSDTDTSEKKSVESAVEQSGRGNGQHLVLEDVDTHVKIEISPAGGTFGRYGTYGSAYLQSDPRGRMVSGEHCRFRYEYGRWSIEHLSRTNDTVYNGRKLEHGYEEAIRDGKIITFANAMSFIVRIF